MVCIMRTTISLNEKLARWVRQQAAASGMRVSAFIARTLDDALKRTEPQEPPPFRLVTVRGSRPWLGVDIDRTRELDAEDDEVWYAPGR